MDLLTEVLAQVKAPTRTHLIEGGNHDFRVPKRLGREPRLSARSGGSHLSVADGARRVTELILMYKDR